MTTVNAITITGSLSANIPTIWSQPVGKSITGLQRNMTGTQKIEGVLSVATSATLIPMGGVTTPHWGFLYNADPTNYIQIMNGSSGAVLLRLLAGDVAPNIPFDPGATLYAIANVAACSLEYLILSA